MSPRAGLLLCALALGCGDRQRPAPATPRPAPGGGDAAPPGDPAPPPAPDASECAALVAHVLDLGLARFRDQARASGKPLPTDDQVAAIRAELTSELSASCRGLDRAVYDCAMAAADIDAYLACESAPP